MKNVQYCPVCGYVAIEGFKDECESKCKVCNRNADIVDTGKLKYDYYEEMNLPRPISVTEAAKNNTYLEYIKTQDLVKEHILKMYICDNPLFDKELSDELERQHKERMKKAHEDAVREANATLARVKAECEAKLGYAATNPVKCPHCGSTLPPQLIRRKWSPLMGIFTNKVDRYCVSCKKKF